MGLLSFLNFGKYKPSEPAAKLPVFKYSGGTVVTPDTSMQVSAFYSGVVYISSQVAKLPWYIKDSSNKKIKNKLHSLLNLSPNPEMDAMDLRLFLVQNAIIYGNGYAEIVRSIDGTPVELWPIPSEDVQVTRIDGQLVYRILGGNPSGYGDAYLLPRDVFHLKNFYTKDGIYGQGVVAYASETLGISLGADRFANSLFTNGGMPSGVLEVEGALSDTAKVRIKESWSNAHGGRKIGGTAILEEGMKYKSISYDPNVLQFLQSRQFSVIEIARFLRIPPTKLYDINAAKFNNMEQENLAVATDILSSWTRRLEIQADVKLLNNGYGGRSTDLDLNDLFRGDMETRSKYFSSMMQNASMSPNEIRESEGREPYEGGDEFYIATNNFSPISRMNEIIDSQISKNEPVEVEPSPEEDEEESTQVDESEVELNNAITKYINSKSNSN